MQLDDSRVLVIGGAGFIGSHIVEKLLAEPVREVIVFDNFIRGKRQNLTDVAGDKRLKIIEGGITDIPSLQSVMDHTDFVFHLAALWLFECVHQPRAALEVNVNGTFNVIEAAQAAGVKKVIFSSSASVYGNALAIPMTESHPFNNRTMYGATKIAGEQFFRSNYDQHGLDYLALRYMNVYGPRMDYRGVYVSVIMKVLDNIYGGKPPVIFGDGSQSYDFVHVDDVARANILALKSDSTDECINIGVGVKTTINELVAMLLTLTGTDLKPEYRHDEKMFVTHRVGCTEKAQKLLGFLGGVSLRDGLQSIVDWRLKEKRENHGGA